MTTDFKDLCKISIQITMRKAWSETALRRHDPLNGILLEKGS